MLRNLDYSAYWVFSRLFYTFTCKAMPKILFSKTSTIIPKNIRHKNPKPLNQPRKEKRKNIGKKQK